MFCICYPDAHMSTVEPRPLRAREIIRSVWTALVRSREYTIYPQSQKNLDYKPSVDVRYVYPCSYTTEETGTRCEFNPWPKVSRADDVYNSWWFSFLFLSPVTPACSSWKNKALFDGSVRRQEGDFRVKTKIWLAVIGGTSLSTSKEERGR